MKSLLAPDLPRQAPDRMTVRLVQVASWTVLVFGSLLAFLLARDPSARLDHVLINLAPVGASGIALLLLHSGRPRLAAQVLVWLIWCVFALVSMRNGGARGPSMLNYPVIVVMAGWLLGARATTVLAVLTGVLFGVLVWGAERAWFPPPNYSSGTAHITYLTGVLLVTAVATLMSRASYVRWVRDARAVASSLGEREVELRKFQLAVEQSPVGIVITDDQNRIDYVNDAHARMTGIPRERWLGKLPAEVSSGSMLADEAVRVVLADGQSWMGEHIGTRHDGSTYPAFATVTPIRQADGRISHHLALEQDLTAQKQAEQRIHRLTNFNNLTGLPNRRQLLRHLEQSFALAARSGAFDALMVFNIDRFQNVNNARGQEAGDRLLSAVGRHLGMLLRRGDFLAHLSADEFALVLHDLGRDTDGAAKHAAAIAQGLHENLLQALPVRGESEGIVITASLGLALYPMDAQDAPEEAVRRAHTALRRAKEGGGRQTAFFETGMGRDAEQRFKLERALRQAIASDQLRLYLQSQVDQHGQVVAAEALVRWEHPDEGLVPPTMFIPVAEQSDLIVELGEWVLEEACRCMAQAARAGKPLQLSVNMSPRQFRQPGMTERVTGLLAQYGVPCEQLVLEVTEGVVMDDVETVAETMRALTQRGVRFSLDDFGTGYSSLRYLKRLPLHEIKIDRSFVQDAPRDRDDAALVETILAVAQHLGLHVVAEGVETAEHAAFLGERAPHIVCQGYLYGTPEPAADWLRRWSGMTDSGGALLQP